jgi:hypothetical protein
MLSKFVSRNVVSNRPITGPVDPDSNIYIGRSEVAMWMRVVSSWICMLLYIWSLLAPVFMPDRSASLRLLVAQLLTWTRFGDI